MRIVIPCVVLLASGCATQSQLSADHAKRCEVAEQKGLIDVAEAACESAWYDVESDRLSPAIQSERLYNLARIKRQLNHYEEADKLIRQSLVIEKTVSGLNSPAYGQRLVELSLCLAAQKKLAEGASTLEPVLDIVDRFPATEQASTANIFMRYASLLRRTDQSQLGNRFELKARALKASQ